MKITNDEFRGIVDWFLGVRECPFGDLESGCPRCFKMMGIPPGFDPRSLYHPCDILGSEETQRRAAKLLKENL